MDMTNEQDKVIVPISDYSADKDKRFLLPFLRHGKIGFANKRGEITISPTFDFYLDEFICESSLIRVGCYKHIAFERKTDAPAIYTRKLYGLLDSKGMLIIPIECEGISAPIFSNRYTLRSNTKGYAVADYNGALIVPFGKYSYIGGFDTGVARVKIGNSSNGLNDAEAKWGVIDEDGKEILPPVYDNIWNFYGKDSQFTRVEKEGEIFEFSLIDKKLQPGGHARQKELEAERSMADYNSYLEYREEQTYEEFNGSYAQEYMGLSDQTINDAFEGDPDAYWNID